MKYQLAVLGPSADRFEKLLGRPLRAGFKALGLDPKAVFEVVREARGDRLDWKSSPVGVWFGGENRDPSPTLEALQARGATVLPLVEDRERFPDLVPDSLRPINGRQWDNPSIPGDLLQAFRLTREMRQAFISYRRIDSQPVADALHDALTKRGYHVFLDTASVAAAARFQDVLWDRLADMDLVVLLDSPNALTSRWVNDELSQINRLRLGVLQLVWPAPHKRFKGTELSTPLDLDPSHFVDGDHSPRGRLTDLAVEAVAARAEEVRIESLGKRRGRVVKELIDRAGRKNLSLHIYPMGPVTFRDEPDAASPIRGVLFPIIGLPDAWSIHQTEKQIRKLREFETGNDLARIEDLLENDGVRIVYDGLGVQSERSDHLGWLNDRLVLKTTRFDRSLNEPVDPLERWLSALAAGSGAVPS